MMSLELLPILVLGVILVISALRSDLNPGVLAAVSALLIGSGLAGLSVGEVARFLPAELLITLIAIALLLEMINDGPMLERLTKITRALAGGHPTLVPISVFWLTFALSAIGAGNIAAVSIMAPIALPLAQAFGIRPLLMAIVVCTGANAGAFSPIALTGSINAGLMRGIGLTDPALPWSVFVAVAMLQLMSAILAYALFGRRPAAAGIALSTPPLRDIVADMDARTLLRLTAPLALIVGVVVFHLPTALVAGVLGALLAVTKLGDLEGAVRRLPWSVIVMVGGVSILVGLLERLGSLDLATRSLAEVASAQAINAALAFVTGLISVGSSSSSVVMPLFIPLLPKLAAELGDPTLLTRMVIAVDVGSHMVDVSPLSTLGALCLASVADRAIQRALFRQLLLWGLAMAVVASALAWVALDLVKLAV
jgi:Na+/H+ antiporter NhaD/arsenite permease-like protein